MDGDATATGGRTGDRRHALRLQAALIALDVSVRRAQEGERRREPPTPLPPPSGGAAAPGAAGEEAAAREAPENVARAVGEVWDALTLWREEGTADLTGVPAWLGPRPVDAAPGDRGADATAPDASGTDAGRPPGGIGLLQERLLGASPLWKRVAARLDHDGHPEMLLDDWEMCTASGRPVRPGPPGEPAAPDDPRGPRGPEAPEGAEDAGGPAAVPAQNPVEVLVPVVHAATGHGFLVELVLRADQWPGPDGDVEGQMTEKFRKGVLAGHRAALGLARHLGVPAAALEQWEKAAVTGLRGIPPGYRVDDTSAGVGTAVAVVRHLVGLPVRGTLVTGGIAADGRVTALPGEEDLAAKSRAAADHGLGLLALSPTWTLREVCSRLWPQEWPQAVERTALESLRTLDHETSSVARVGTDETVAGQRFKLVRLRPAEEILQRLAGGATTVVVGGRRASARTTSARQAALEWGRERALPVIELRLHEGRLPDEADLRHVVTLARYAHRTPPGERAIVILEDLLPYEGGADLDAVLPMVAEATETTIIAVCLYVGGARWTTDRVATVPSLVRHEEVRDFSRRFVDLNGMGAVDDGRLGVARQAAHNDVWFLVHLLMDMAAPPVSEAPGAGGVALAATATRSPAAPSGAGSAPVAGGARIEGLGADRAAATRRAFVRRVRGQVAPDRLAHIRAIAACGLLRVAVPGALLPGIMPAELHRAGAERDWAGRWHIPRSAACRALLATEESLTDRTGQEWMRTANAQFEALRTLLDPHLHAYDRTVLSFVTAVLTAASTTEPALHRRLLLYVSPSLTRHIGVHAPPGLVAHALLAGGVHFRPGQRRELFATLVRSIVVNGWRSLTAREATTCMAALRAHRDHASGHVRSDYREVLDAVERELKPVLRRSDPAQGVLCVHEVGRFFEAPTARAVLPLVVAATHRCDPRLVDHYEAAVGLVHATLKYGSEQRYAILDRLAHTPGLVRLLAADQRHDAGLTLAQAALALQLGAHGDHVRTRPARLGQAVSRALPGAPPDGVTRGLMLLQRVDVRSGRAIVRHSTIPQWLRMTVSSADTGQVTPWQVARLFHVLRKMDVTTLVQTLYSGEGDVDEAVVDALVACVHTMGDLKGVGVIVHAVAAVENFWGPGGRHGVGARLCARFEAFVFRALETEMRGSVVLALMTGLTEGGVATDTLGALLERCAEVVAGEARDNEKDHAPRLALLLARHEAVGPRFLETLAPRLDDGLLLHRAKHCQSVEARAYYLELARALRRTRDVEFIHQLAGHDWLEDLRDGGALPALKALRAYDLALRDAPLTHSPEQLVREVDGDPAAWARRLYGIHHPGLLGEALHLLRGLAPGFAVECLRELDALHRPGDRFRALAPAPVGAAPVPTGPSPQRVADLHRRRSDRARADRRELGGLLRYVQRQFVHADQAVELVHAVRKVDDEGGTAIGAALAASDHWEKRVLDLVDTDAPVHLGNLLRMMAEAHLELPGEVLDRLGRTWKTQAYAYRSPAVAQSLMCGFAACGPAGVDLAREWAASLNTDQIARRLARGLPSDLAAAPRLVRALALWGPPGSAAQVAAELPVDAVRHVDLRRGVELLHTLAETDPERAREHARAAADVLAAKSALRFLPDPEAHWHHLGWLVRITRTLGGGKGVDPAAVLADLTEECRRPEVVNWVTGCLGLRPPEDGWDAPGGSPPWARAARLIVRSDLGLPCAATPAEVSDLLGRLTVHWQVNLLRCAERDGGLRATLSGPDLEYLAQLGDWYVEVGRPEGAALTAAARALHRSPRPRRGGAG
ncbi:hypothetical protein WDH52_17635 [Streptomyces sp. TRM70308]|uniref:hypothetical protein n=1 Tax=Streptomyces sp. TRM70308 TaxID=3131932 RepID=UPI003CFC669D